MPNLISCVLVYKKFAAGCTISEDLGRISTAARQRDYILVADFACPSGVQSEMCNFGLSAGLKVAPLISWAAHTTF
jgi:hypothetical protein